MYCKLWEYSHHQSKHRISQHFCPIGFVSLIWGNNESFCKSFIWFLCGYNMPNRTIEISELLLTLQGGLNSTKLKSVLVALWWKNSKCSIRTNLYCCWVFFISNNLHLGKLWAFVLADRLDEAFSYSVNWVFEQASSEGTECYCFISKLFCFWQAFSNYVNQFLQNAKDDRHANSCKNRKNFKEGKVKITIEASHGQGMSG